MYHQGYSYLCWTTTLLDTLNITKSLEFVVTSLSSIWLQVVIYEYGRKHGTIESQMKVYVSFVYNRLDKAQVFLKGKRVIKYAETQNLALRFAQDSLCVFVV